MENSVLEGWKEIGILMTDVDLDVRKNASGNASAGVRARKVLRTLRRKLGALTKQMIAEERERKSEKGSKEE